MKSIGFEEIISKIIRLDFKEKYDAVCGIMMGGVVPAYLIAEFLKTDLFFIKSLYRNEDNEPLFEKPKISMHSYYDYRNKNILIVDDRSKTGITLKEAKKFLKEAGLLKTFVVNGKADYNLFDESCFIFPWKNLNL